MSYREKGSRLQTIVTFRAVGPMIIAAVLPEMMMRVSPVMPDTFLAMLKLTAKMQHTFHREDNIRHISLTSLVEELSERVTSTESQCMHGATFLAITTNTNNYAGFVSLPTGQKPPPYVPLHSSSVVQMYSCMHARTLPCTLCKRSFSAMRRLRQCQMIG